MADVRMVQGRNSASLAFHALLEFRRGREIGRKNFNSYNAIEPRVAGAIYLAHTASSNGREDFIGTELRARGKGHSVTVIIVQGTGPGGHADDARRRARRAALLDFLLPYFEDQILRF